MPTLNWIGKDKVINHHMDVPYKILEHQFGFDNGTQSNNETNSGNKIIHGDNLEALKALLPEYEGKIKCIYIDPPYNTGEEKWAYNDNVNHPKIKKWLGEIVGKEGDDLSRHDKWLCMMYPRLKLLQKLLSLNGAIFISLDENEISNARLVCNEIFGCTNFVAQLSLLCNPKGRSQDKYFATNHEYCLVYSKSVLASGSFSIEKDDDQILKDYKLLDNNGRYRLLELRNTHREFNKENRPNLFYPLFINPANNNVSLSKTDEFTVECFPIWNDGYEGCWTWGKELSLQDLHLLEGKKKNGDWKIYRKSYAQKQDGEKATKKLFTILNDSRFYTEKGQLVFGEIFPGLNKNDFPQPKSVDFVKELINTITDNDSIILDSFAGSGTTAHAVLNLNNQDGGNRKFILVEMEDYAENITAERVKRVINGYGGDKKAVEGTGGSFDYYELGLPLFLENDVLNEEIGLEKIREYVWFSETRSSYLKTNEKEEYLLGLANSTAYYFYYFKDQFTTLDDSFLRTLKTKAEQYIIYADNCVLDNELMQKYHIIFKKIPRDITRF